MNDSGRIILILGGARSGKSTFAERLAADLASDTSTGSAAPGAPARSGSARVTYLATLQPYDDDMVARIAKHQADRPEGWRTVECPQNVGAALRSHAAGTDVFLLDCVTLMVTNLVFAEGAFGGSDSGGVDNFDKSRLPADEEAAAVARVRGGIDDLLAAVAETGATLIAVSNEVGLGLVPEYPLGRLYRDHLGWANQHLARVADEVYFLVAGIPLDLKSLDASPFGASLPRSPHSSQETAP